MGCMPDSIDETIEKFNKGDIPYMTVTELQACEDCLVLDTRTLEEYSVSHIDGAQHVGYKRFDPTFLEEQRIERTRLIAVYCSVGVRSEEIGRQIMELGYSNVRNLHGGIFQWKIDGKKVVNQKGMTTDSVHAYSRIWGHLLTTGIKVY